jgi:hypothetical protein
MRVLTSERFGRWTRYTGIVAVAALVWAVFVPDGIFWSAVVAAGLIGSAVATTILVRSRGVPSLAQVIATAEAVPVVVTSGAGLRSIGERKP